MVRSWLRRWLGIEGDASVSLLRLDALEGKCAGLLHEIEALKYMRQQREARQHSRMPMDWERVQADFAANPENYKES